MSRTFCALALAALIPLSAQAGEHRDAVIDLLNAVEQPATRADLDAIGEGMAAELLEIANDEAVPTSRRGRAISALAFYPTEEVQLFLREKAEKADKSIYRRKAVLALGEAFGEQAVEWVAPYLGDKDEQLRMATARALGNIGTEPARVALTEQRKQEKDAAVAEVIDKALAKEVSP